MQTSTNGKGDKWRTTNFKRYWDNFPKGMSPKEKIRGQRKYVAMIDDGIFHNRPIAEA